MLWLIVVKDLLRQLARAEVWVVKAFAYDVFVAVRIPAVYRFADVLSPVLAEIHRWATKCNLEFSYSKCCHTIVPARGRCLNALSRPDPHGSPEDCLKMEFTILESYSL